MIADKILFLIAIGIICLAVFSIIHLLYTNAESQKQTNEIKEPLRCKGTYYDIDNCKMINEKLDKILERLE